MWRYFRLAQVEWWSSIGVLRNFLSVFFRLHIQIFRSCVFDYVSFASFFHICYSRSPFDDTTQFVILSSLSSLIRGFTSSFFLFNLTANKIRKYMEWITADADHNTVERVNATYIPIGQWLRVYGTPRLGNTYFEFLRPPYLLLLLNKRTKHFSRI